MDSVVEGVAAEEVFAEAHVVASEEVCFNFILQLPLYCAVIEKVE